MEDISTDAGFQTPNQTQKKGKKNCCIISIVLLLIALIMLAGFLIYVFSLAKKIEEGKINPAQVLNNNINLSTNNNLDVILPDPYLGPPEAKVTVTEFSDFECPACKAAYPIVKEINREYKDRIKYVHKDLPILSLHPNSLNAALAGQCAHEQDMFWQMHDKMFINQDALATADLKRYGIELGLDSMKFSTCLDSKKYYTSVNQDYEQALSIGINSTPTFIINDQIIRGVISIEAFSQLIDKALQQP